jgi:hypothetical protein
MPGATGTATDPCNHRYRPALALSGPGRWKQTPASTLVPGIPHSRKGRSTGSEMVFNDVIEETGMTLDAAGVVIIVIGAAIAFALTTVRLARRERDIYRRFRQRLGQNIRRMRCLPRGVTKLLRWCSRRPPSVV